jgi:N-acetyl-beta-hexosaminidase
MNYDKKIDLLQLRLVRIEDDVISYKAYVDRHRNSCAGWTTEFVETILNEIHALAKFNNHEKYED